MIVYGTLLPMSFESNGSDNQFSPAQIMAQILEIESRVMSMGANDYEPSAFEAIKKDLLDGTITPKDALLKAKNILESKQDYH